MSLFVSKKFQYALLLSGIAFSWTSPAYAYLDPGTGTIILQGLIAAIGGIMGFFYFYLDKVKSAYRRLRGIEGPEEISAGGDNNPKNEDK